VRKKKKRSLSSDRGFSLRPNQNDTDKTQTTSPKPRSRPLTDALKNFVLKIHGQPPLFRHGCNQESEPMIRGNGAEPKTPSGSSSLELSQFGEGPALETNLKSTAVLVPENGTRVKNTRTKSGGSKGKTQVHLVALERTQAPRLERESGR